MCVCVCIYIYIYIYIYITYIFLISSSIDRHSGVSISWLLWIMLQWTWERRYLWDTDFISFDYMPKVWLLDHMVVLFLIFWGTSLTVFYKWPVPVCIPTDSVHVFCFLQTPHQHLFSLAFLIKTSWVVFLKTNFLFPFHFLVLSHIHILYIYPGLRKVGWKCTSAETEREIGSVLVIPLFRCSCCSWKKLFFTLGFI